MKELKKFLSLFLVLCMVAGFMPETAFAAEVTPADTVEEVVEAEAEEIEAEEAEEIEVEEETETPKEEAVVSTQAVEAEKPEKPEDGTTTGNPFIKGTAGSNSFRIPSMVTLSDGTLVAAADARWNTTYDGGGADTIVSRSTDNGATWSYTFANYLGDNGNSYNGSGSTDFIDPALAVAEDDTIYMLVDIYPYGIALNGNGSQTAPSNALGFDGEGRLKLTANNGNDGYPYYLNTENGLIYDSSSTDSFVEHYTVEKNFDIYKDGVYVSNLFFSDSPYKVVRTGYLYLTKSTDKGETWSDPQLLPFLKESTEQVCLVGPGHGNVLSDGTIMFPVYSYNGSQASEKTGFIYSTDDGATWKRSKSSITQSSEASIVELSSSTLRMFYRNASTHICYVDITKNGNNYYWGSSVDTNVACNSNTELSAIKVTSGGKDYILVSNPGYQSAESSAANRKNGQIVTFKASDMSVVKTTSVPSVHTTDSFMYSCMTQMKNGNIAILYEDEESGWGAGSNYYYQMSFKTFALDELGIAGPITDAETGISVTAEDGTALTAISAEETTVNGMEGDYVAYDITLNNGAFTGAADITIPLSDALRSADSVTGFIVENGEVKEISGGTKSADGNTFTFRAPHFSVVGAKSGESETEMAVNLEAGETSKEFTVSETTNYGSETKTTDDGVVSYVQTGMDGEPSYTASSKEMSELGATSVSYTKTNYYYKVGNNYYPLYIRYYSSSYRNYFYVGYSPTDSASDVTQIESYKYTTDTLQVYTRDETQASSASTKIKFKGLAVGTTSVKVGTVTYNITVSEKKVDETKVVATNSSVTLDPEVPEGGTVTYEVIGGSAYITLDGAKVTTGDTKANAQVKATVKAANGNAYAVYTYVIKISDVTNINDDLTLAQRADEKIQVTLTDGQTVEWTSADASIAGVGKAYSGETATNEAIVLGNNPGETTITATVKDAEGTPVAIYTWDTTVTAADDTNITSRYIYVNVTQIENCTVYYAINGGELIKIEGTGVLIDSQMTGHFNIMFFADPDEGHALTYMCVTGSAKQYYHLSNGNPDGTGSDAWPFESNDQTTIPSSSSDSAWKSGHGFRWSLLEGNMTIDRMKAMFAQAIALGCDGATNFTKNSTANFYTEVQFVAQPLPTIEKEIVSITSNGTATPYTAGTKVELGDTINYKVTVTKPAYLTGNVWSDNSYTVTNPITDSNKPTYSSGNYGIITYSDEVLTDEVTNNDGITNPALGTSGATAQTYTYTTRLEVTMNNYAQVVKNGVITNTADLDYSYKSQYSSGKGAAAANAKAEVEVKVPEYVVDFGLPVEIDLGSALLGTATITGGSASYGDVAVDGTKFTYTPTTTLKGKDHVTLRLSNGNSYGVNIYPATTVYYEEGFAEFGNGWSGYEKGTAKQNTAILGSDANNYGYDAAYKDTAGNSNGTAAVSNTNGAKGTFTFTGTGVDVFANCDKNAGVTAIIVKNKSGATKFFGMINTASNNGETENLTIYPEGDIYNVPVASIQDLDYGTYTVSLIKYGAGEVTLDGYKVYNTIDETKTTDSINSIYLADDEDYPVFIEARDLNFAAIDLSGYGSRYASNKTNQIYKQVAQTEGVNALITSTKGATVEASKDLIDNGPKNEIYLYPGMTLTFGMLSTQRVAQVGLRGIQSPITCTLADRNQAVSTTDMYYTVKAKGATGTYVISNPADSNSILAVTKIKVCDDPGVVSVPEITEDALDTALKVMTGEEVEDSDVTKTSVESIKISSNASNKIAAGKKVQLTAIVAPENATDASVTWTSSNEKVAKVSETGVVTAVKAGKATITATANDGSKVTGTYKLQVMKGAVKSISLKAKGKVKAGASVKVKATVKTTGKSANKQLVWKVSDKTLAKVSKNGTVKISKKAKKGTKIKVKAYATDGSKIAKGIYLVVK